VVPETISKKDLFTKLFTRSCSTVISAGILEQPMVARNRVGIGLSYRPARLQRLAESIAGLLK
jgi:hypothetical protein